MQMFNDPNGKTSVTRVVFALVTLIFMGTWATISIKNGEMVPVDPGVLGVIFTLATGKSISSFAEHKK